MESVNGGGSSSRRDKPWTPPFCTIVDVETTSFSYLACSSCERALPNPPTCAVCSNKYTFSTSSKRLYRLLLSVAIVDKVIPVMCFDRMARVLLGCSADDFFNFCKSHPFSAEKMGEILEGEMFQMTLLEPKNGNAQHIRVVSIIPLRTGFRPVIQSLRLLYGVPVEERLKMEERKLIWTWMMMICFMIVPIRRMGGGKDKHKPDVSDNKDNEFLSKMSQELVGYPSWLLLWLSPTRPSTTIWVPSSTWCLYSVRIPSTGVSPTRLPTSWVFLRSFSSSPSTSACIT